jgi:V/A-type H+-transporting ATPase subunit C
MEKDMPARYNDTEYMYSSAKIRALETRMLGSEGCDRLLAARDSDGVFAMLADYGYTVVKKQGEADGGTRIDREATLMSALSAGFSEIAGITPQPLTAKILQYKYDCNNIKAAIKGRARSIDPRDMMFPIGTVSLENVIEAVKTGDYKAFPKHMAEAAAKASEAYVKTKNPQDIDIILDKACFCDMTDAARQTGVPFIIKYVKALIDLTCIIMCIRVLRMKSGETGRSLLEYALPEGGELEKEFILSGYDKGEVGFLASLKNTQYSEFADKLKNEASLSYIEREADRYIMNIVREVKWIPFGAELATAYLIALEYGLKNIRIIMAGKDAGLEDAAIRERMREMYV